MKETSRRAFIVWTGAASVLCLLPSATIAAPPEGKGKNAKTKDQPHGHDSASTATLVRAGISVAAARDLFRRTGGSPESYKPLPPGIRKNLARGKPIPPGIAKTRLPGNYVGQLPHYPGYEWLGAGLDLLLVQTASGVIADVLIDVFR
jgi:hypothetical protein